jgi:hypothetical protein
MLAVSEYDTKRHAAVARAANTRVAELEETLAIERQATREAKEANGVAMTAVDQARQAQADMAEALAARQPDPDETVPVTTILDPAIRPEVVAGTGVSLSKLPTWARMGGVKRAKTIVPNGTTVETPLPWLSTTVPGVQLLRDAPL